nr:lipoprotein [uncultured Caldimonas sp.]
MSKRALILATGVVTALLVGLSACGQKGALYLPGQAAQTPASAASQPSNPASR